MAGTTFLPSLGGLRQASATAALAGGDTPRRNMAAKSVIPASSVSLHRSAGSSGCQKRIRSTILQTWARHGLLGATDHPKKKRIARSGNAV